MFYACFAMSKLPTSVLRLFPHVEAANSRQPPFFFFFSSKPRAVWGRKLQPTAYNPHISFMLREILRFHNKLLRKTFNL